MMNKEQKKNYITEMTANFENSEAVLVTHYQGLTVKQLDELRKQMRDQGIQFKIDSDRSILVTYEKNSLNFEEIINYLTQNNIKILDIVTEDGDLEDVFVQLTNR